VQCGPPIGDHTSPGHEFGPGAPPPICRKTQLWSRENGSFDFVHDNCLNALVLAYGTGAAEELVLVATA
jgi:hypothetical protein